jgi:hypothetical protein
MDKRIVSINNSSRLLQSFPSITKSGVRNRMYAVDLMPEIIDGENAFGVQFQIMDGNRHIVTDFSRHPKTNDLLPAERCKRINLMDQLMAINDFVMSNVDIKDNWKNIEKLMRSPNASTAGLTLKMRSAEEMVAWFECCHCQHQIIVDSVLRTVSKTLYKYCV